MKIVFLDAATLGDDLSFTSFDKFGDVTVYPNTDADSLTAHAGDADAVVLNKIKLYRPQLERLPNLKLICITATGFDNVDIEACRERGIAVCNVAGYSTQCVAQLTVTMVLSLLTHLTEYNTYVHSGAYTASGCFNRLTPTFHELYGKTWGIVGFGNIGRAVGEVAKAFGCNVLVHKRTPVADWNCVDMETLCKESDIVSLHTPLNDTTRNLLNAERIALLKPNAIVVNVARGAVADEASLAQAVKTGKIAGLGVDVYSTEPFPKEHPYTALLGMPNVCLTPHMAWGGYETRIRLLYEVEENIASFLANGTRCRVDIH